MRLELRLAVEHLLALDAGEVRGGPVAEDGVDDAPVVGERRPVAVVLAAQRAADALGGVTEVLRLHAVFDCDDDTRRVQCYTLYTRSATAAITAVPRYAVHTRSATYHSSGFLFRRSDFFKVM